MVTKRRLWRTFNDVIHPPLQHPIAKFSAEDFANFFRSKVAGIRMNAATPPLPYVQPHSSIFFLCSFDAVTILENFTVLASSPTKSYSLDPLLT